MEIDFDIRGDQELDALLVALQDAIKRPILETALLKAAKPTVDLAKQLAPVGAGRKPGRLKRPRPHLRDTIRAVRGFSKRERRRRRASRAAELGLRNGRNLTRAEGKAVDAEGEGRVTITANSPHAHLVERGHAIVAVKRGLFRTKITVTGHVPAYPFMRPAWDQTQARFPSIFAAEVSAAIESAVRKSGLATSAT